MAQLIATDAATAAQFDWNAGDSKYFDRTQKALNDLMDVSDKLPEGEVVGGIITFPVADGKAIYKVVCAKPLKLMHIPYGDAYRVSPAHIRGLRLAEVQQMIHRKRLFGRSR